MSNIETCNAIIGSAGISIEDHDLLTVWLSLDYGGSVQCFGGYALLVGPHSEHRRDGERGPNYAGVFIDRVMRIAGVTRWDHLPGKTVRVRQEPSRVHAIGHIIRDDWFEPSVEFCRLKDRSDD